MATVVAMLPGRVPPGPHTLLSLQQLSAMIMSEENRAKFVERERLRHEYDSLMLYILMVTSTKGVTWRERQARFRRFVETHPNAKSWIADK